MICLNKFLLVASNGESPPILDKAFKALKLMEKYDVSIVEQPMSRDRLRD